MAIDARPFGGGAPRSCGCSQPKLGPPCRRDAAQGDGRMDGRDGGQQSGDGAEAKQGRGRGDAEELGVQGGIHGGAALSRGARAAGGERRRMEQVRRGRGGRDGRDRARGFKARRARQRVGMRPDARTRGRRSCRGAARDGGSSEGDGIDERREERGKVRRRGGGLDSPASRRWRREATPWRTAEEGDRARDAPGGGGWTRGRDVDRAGLARVRSDRWGAGWAWEAGPVERKNGRGLVG